MTRNTYDIRSYLMIAPVAKQADMIALANAVGYTAEFSFALSASGQAPATHGALHTTVQRGFWYITAPDQAPTTLDAIYAERIADPAPTAGRLAWLDREESALWASAIILQRAIDVTGWTEQYILDLLANCTVSAERIVNDVMLTGRTHLDHVATGMGLQPVEVSLS